MAKRSSPLLCSFLFTQFMLLIAAECKWLYVQDYDELQRFEPLTIFIVGQRFNDSKTISRDHIPRCNLYIPEE